jgi:hypothetical protein
MNERFFTNELQINTSMKSSDWLTVILFSAVILCILSSGCTTTPQTVEQPVVTKTAVMTHPPTAAQTVTVQETAVIPPESPSRYPIDGIGNDGLWALYTVSGNSKTGIRVDTFGTYRFGVTKYDGKSLKLYITDWAGSKTVELYDSTKDPRNSEKAPGTRPALNASVIDAGRTLVTTNLGAHLDTTVELVKGNYYIWAVTDGPFSFQVGFDK